MHLHDHLLIQKPAQVFTEECQVAKPILQPSN